MPAELSISIIRHDGSTTLQISGELDVATATELRAALHDVHGPVRFDLERLSFIDARGVRVLAEVARTNGATTIVNAPSLIRRVLVICQMDTWLAGELAHDTS